MHLVNRSRKSLSPTLTSLSPSCNKETTASLHQGLPILLSPTGQGADRRGSWRVRVRNVISHTFKGHLMLRKWLMKARKRLRNRKGRI